MDVLIVSFLCLGTAIAALYDFKTGKIPNLLTFPMMILGLSYHTASTGLNGLGFSAGGLFLGIGILMIVYLAGGIGAGDAKLLGAVGSMVGYKGIIIAGAFSILLGFMYAIVLLLFHLDYARSLFLRVGRTVKSLFLTGQVIAVLPEGNGKQPALRYAIPIALGTMSYVVLKLTGSSLIQDLVGFQFGI